MKPTFEMNETLYAVMHTELQAAWLWLVLEPSRLSGLASGSSSANSLNHAALSSFFGTAEEALGFGVCGGTFFSGVGVIAASRTLDKLWKKNRFYNKRNLTSLADLIACVSVFAVKSSLCSSSKKKPLHRFNLTDRVTSEFITVVWKGYKMDSDMI